MAKTVCKILGVVFLLVGVCGFAAPRLLGAHLTPPHNVVHIVSGAIALYFGFAGTLSGAKIFSLIFGVVYLALGILGMALGHPEGVESHMWVVGPLHLGQSDHLIHVVLGIVFLAGGLFTKKT
jgi:mannose/fructose/N-acetylgalactosamine-specific phosphotransferase system component IID